MVVKNKRTIRTKIFRAFRQYSLLFVLSVFVFISFTTTSRQAFSTIVCTNCTCVITEHAGLQSLVAEQHVLTQEHFGTAAPIPGVQGKTNAPTVSGTGLLGLHQDFLINDIFLTKILPAWMMMTEQMTTVMMLQMQAVGQFLDAKHQLETQQLFQQLTAEAHKDYQPDLGMCVFGTNIRSLAAADHHMQFTNFALSQRSQDRQLGHINSNASEGRKEDREGRLEQFKEQFCDPHDNNPTGAAGTGLELLCNGNAPTSVNKDIDIQRTVYLPRTLEIDLADDEPPSEDEQAVMAMANNLYAHDVFSRIGEPVISVEANQDEYLDLRSIVAKRSVAENSFHAIAAMKTQGSIDPHPNGGDGNAVDTAQYMKILMQELGLPDDEITQMIGERPSYLSQLEILAKRIYQRPEFYTELYGKPVNVERRSVAMQAIGLMLDRDTYNSYLRSESMMSILLETKTIRLQEEIQDSLNKMDADPI